MLVPVDIHIHTIRLNYEIFIYMWVYAYIHMYYTALDCTCYTALYSTAGGPSSAFAAATAADRTRARGAGVALSTLTRIFNEGALILVMHISHLYIYWHPLTLAQCGILMRTIRPHSYLHFSLQLQAEQLPWAELASAPAVSGELNAESRPLAHSYTDGGARGRVQGELIPDAAAIGDRAARGGRGALPPKRVMAVRHSGSRRMLALSPGGAIGEW